MTSPPLSRPGRCLTSAITAVTLGLATAAAEPPAAPSADGGQETQLRQTEQARYAGSWRVVTVESNGEVNADDDRVIIVDNQPDGGWKLTVDGREVASGTNRFDPLAVPKAIDIEITAGDGRGTILRGIYEIGDETRRLCFRGGNGWRPREFSGAIGSDSVLVVFERQRAPPAELKPAQ